MIKILNLKNNKIDLLLEQLNEIKEQLKEIQEKQLKNQCIYLIGNQTHYTFKINDENIIIEVLEPQC